MNEATKKNRWIFVLIVSISVIPLALAWLLKAHPEWIKARKNYGELIIPPVPLEREQLVGFDAFSADNMGEIKGRWVLLHIIGPEGCGATCRDAMFKSKQLRLMLSKDLTRVRRLVAVVADVDEAAARPWWQDDELLLRSKPKGPLTAKLKAAIEGFPSDGALFLMDPFGNLMMRYKPGFDPYGVKKDLSHLLNVSQIG